MKGGENSLDISGNLVIIPPYSVWLAVDIFEILGHFQFVELLNCQAGV